MREKQPVYINNNCYLDEAQPFDREETNINTKQASNISVTMENGKIHLEIMLPEEFDDLKPYGIKTETLANRVYANCRLKMPMVLRLK